MAVVLYSGIREHITTRQEFVSLRIVLADITCFVRMPPAYRESAARVKLNHQFAVPPYVSA